MVAGGVFWRECTEYVIYQGDIRIGVTDGETTYSDETSIRLARIATRSWPSQALWNQAIRMPFVSRRRRLPCQQPVWKADGEFSTPSRIQTCPTFSQASRSSSSGSSIRGAKTELAQLICSFPLQGIRAPMARSSVMAPSTTVESGRHHWGSAATKTTRPTTAQ